MTFIDRQQGDIQIGVVALPGLLNSSRNPPDGEELGESSLPTTDAVQLSAAAF
jgi:hypothetical protein